jgi:polyhydroxybutyrate depolymerase
MIPRLTRPRAHATSRAAIATLFLSAASGACGGEEPPASGLAAATGGAGGEAGGGGSGGLDAGGAADGGLGGSGLGEGAGAGGAQSEPFTCVGMGPASGNDTLELEVDGRSRSARVHVPASYDPDVGSMVVLNFHGFAMPGLQQDWMSRMTAASDAHGFIAVHPEGVGMSWNAGDCCGNAWTDEVDDVAFVDALLDRLESEYCVDPARVFATGMSNGGFFSHRLACELSERIAAVAPVAGVMGIDPSTCTPTRPVPLLDFHGTSDPMVPFGGGTPLVPQLGFGLTFRSVADTMAVWRQLDGCSDEAQVVYAQGDASCSKWSGCAADLELCTIDGGGHTWPGGEEVILVGKTSHDIDATERMITFFEAHPMN